MCTNFESRVTCGPWETCLKVSVPDSTSLSEILRQVRTLERNRSRPSTWERVAETRRTSLGHAMLYHDRLSECSCCFKTLVSEALRGGCLQLVDIGICVFGHLFMKIRCSGFSFTSRKWKLSLVSNDLYKISLKNDSWPWQLSKQLEHGDFVVVSPVYCQRKAE